MPGARPQAHRPIPLKLVTVVPGYPQHPGRVHGEPQAAVDCTSRALQCPTADDERYSEQRGEERKAGEYAGSYIDGQRVTPLPNILTLPGPLPSGAPDDAEPPTGPPTRPLPHRS